MEVSFILWNVFMVFKRVSNCIIVKKLTVIEEFEAYSKNMSLNGTRQPPVTPAHVRWLGLRHALRASGPMGRSLGLLVNKAK